MIPVDYDRVAGTYDHRYEQHEYGGVLRTVLGFAAAAGPIDVLEVGCGTGHWLAELGRGAASIVGLDPSRPMLDRARTAAPSAGLVQGRAETLPFRPASLDRVVCVNALHHFADPRAFFAEARRVLRPGGGLLTIGLDPHEGRDRWWIYEYFPEALTSDRDRFLPAEEIRRLLSAAGFTSCETREAQHMPGELSMQDAAARGLLERSSTSQLMVIGDQAWAAGVERMRAAAAAAGQRGPTLRADLRLHATVGWVPAGDSPASRPDPVWLR